MRYPNSLYEEYRTIDPCRDLVTLLRNRAYSECRYYEPFLVERSGARDGGL